MQPTCRICFTDDPTFLHYDGFCGNWFCEECLKQHIKTKLLEGKIPRCPVHSCTRNMTVQNCLNILTTKLRAIWEQRVKEESIPLKDRVYCPRPRCSALMSKPKINKSTEKGCESKGWCSKCFDYFCINCYVPWHSNLSCKEYRRLRPDPTTNDMLLRDLANRKGWHQCKMCKHMIELSGGCNHVICRCGYEFFYVPGGTTANFIYSLASLVMIILICWWIFQ